MDFFDAWMLVDQEWGVAPRRFSDADSLSRILDKYGIGRALVSAPSEKRPGSHYVNDLIFQAAQHDPRFVPAPMVLPNSGLEVGIESEYVRELVERGARAVCFYPQSCGTSLDDRVIGPLFDALAKHCLPVALFETDWLPAADLALRYPTIPFILHRPSYRCRQMLPVLKDTPNLYVSLAPNFAPYRGIETLVAHCGAERLLFATGYPQSEPGAAFGYLLYSALDDETAAQIASGNLSRMVEAVKLDPREEAPSATPTAAAEAQTKRVAGLCSMVWAREPVKLKGIVDMHAHYGAWMKFAVWGGHADDLVEEMDRVGVEKVIVAHHSCMCDAVKHGNDSVLAGIAKYPARIMGYAVCYPANDSMGIEEVERAVEAGMVGIKLHNASGINYTDERCKPVWEYANAKRLPVLLHTWGDIDKFETLFEAYTECPILLGHAGCVNADKYVECAHRFPHLWLELCYSRAPYGLVEYFVEEVGAGRVLYGSDAPWMPFGHQLSRVLFADISDADKEQILVENPRQVLKC